MPSELTSLIPGIYADDEGCIYVHMREFLVQHGIPDTPEGRGGCMGRDIEHVLRTNHIRAIGMNTFYVSGKTL
jgi:hypothetical protein